MPSLFPDLFTWGFLITAVLRVAVAVLHAEFARGLWNSHHQHHKLLGGVWGAAALALFVGLFTQVVALLLGALIGKELLHKREYGFEEKRYLILLLIVTLSFVFFGSGAFAFDLPL